MGVFYTRLLLYPTIHLNRAELHQLINSEICACVSSNSF